MNVCHSRSRLISQIHGKVRFFSVEIHGNVRKTSVDFSKEVSIHHTKPRISKVDSVRYLQNDVSQYEDWSRVVLEMYLGELEGMYILHVVLDSNSAQ